VLVVGGTGATSILGTAEVYDWALGVWLPTGSLLQARRNHTATLLNNGRVLVVGGENGTTRPYLASAELY
jgi:N-acetylneuraminic acid mutarotase